MEFSRLPQNWPNKNCSLSLENLVKMTAAINETQSMSSCYNPAANIPDKTLACCLLFSLSLAGNTFIEIIVFKTKTLKKPINLLMVNMAISDMFVPIFLFPRILV